jgi:uncharacterized coiled-coil protein SlyX
MADDVVADPTTTELETRINELETRIDELELKINRYQTVNKTNTIDLVNGVFAITDYIISVLPEYLRVRMASRINDYKQAVLDPLTQTDDQ